MHRGTHLRRGRRCHHVCAHRAYQWSCNVCRHVRCNGNGSYNLVHWQSHGQGFWSNCSGKGLLESLGRRRNRCVLRKRTIQNKGGRQICGSQRLLNRTNCLGLSRFCSSLCLEKKINCLFNRKSIAIVYMEIKVTATQRPLSSFVFYQKRSMCSLKTITDPPIHLSPLYLPPYMVPPGTWTKTNLSS